MNRRRRPLKLHLRAAPKQKIPPYRSSPKRPLKVVLAGVCLALIMLGALSFAAFTLAKNAHLKHQGHAPGASPSATASALLAGSANPVPTTIKSPPVASVSATPSVAKVLATPSPSPSATPVSRPTAVVASGTPRETKTPSEVSRKSAEQRRKEAERKRARLEAQYRNHEISEEVYKKGQQEYQAELAKYHSAVSGAGSAN
ncbi:MAG: hypothetical protein JO025_06180 [Verrucomicrobia bacterium]|nr:hypothetical protein [Verrucomicrobiota bacterium]